MCVSLEFAPKTFRGMTQLNSKIPQSHMTKASTSIVSSTGLGQ